MPADDHVSNTTTLVIKTFGTIRASIRSNINIKKICNNL